MIKKVKSSELSSVLNKEQIDLLKQLDLHTKDIHIYMNIKHNCIVVLYPDVLGEIENPIAKNDYFILGEKNRLDMKSISSYELDIKLQKDVKFITKCIKPDSDKHIKIYSDRHTIILFIDDDKSINTERIDFDMNMFKQWCDGDYYITRYYNNNHENYVQSSTLGKNIEEYLITGFPDLIFVNEDWIEIINLQVKFNLNI